MPIVILEPGQTAHMIIYVADLHCIMSDMDWDSMARLPQ